MKVYETVTEDNKRVEKVLCNCCGKEITKQHGYFSDYLHIEKQWGYFSQKDSRKDNFDICENCYDKFVNSFVLPIEYQ
ncbi:hypothetical protein [Clostridium sp. MD294]|uniref:hypothetical protein n=1 Tax=Clostridium sp. MD294 TaxID=97138 RepID=UPI0002CA3FB8|nr:hypothetical protein [Clostridium sp. MD294]NDO45950.1 hypothetical protein [Clostridium sp. MD294]USF30391.1 hypothetical protein C820_001832 [Clostridium sp. MD294]